MKIIYTDKHAQHDPQIFFVRGVGTTNAAVGEEGANAFYVDGKVFSFGHKLSFNDRQGVQVAQIGAVQCDPARLRVDQPQPDHRHAAEPGEHPHARGQLQTWVRDQVHDGQGMGGTSYRVTIKPMIPGGKPDDANFRDLESMPVRSIITNPANGAIVARKANVTITATASDNVGVTRVDFLVNGALQCSDTTAPYSCVWRVPGAANKTHQLQARAFDAAGNSATASIQVTAQ